MMNRRNSIAVAVLFVCGLTAVASAASPGVTVVTPRGVQRGTEADIVVHGQRLADAKEVLFYQPGITVTKLDSADAQNLKVHVQIAKDAAIGEYPLRVRTATGLSDVRTFFVTAYPVVEEKEPNNDQEHAQPIQLNTTVSGLVTNEDMDYFVVGLKKGQRITAEVQGIRLGDALFDPYVAILDGKKFSIAECDDTALGRQDPIASAIAPEDGKYYVLVRDTSYGGAGNFHYLLTVGSFPRPTVIFPLGGKAGEELSVKFLGDVAGELTQKVKLPAEPAPSLSIFAEQDGMLSPTANFLRVSAFANVMEQEGDNDLAHATPATQDIPLALNGIISKARELDYFRFKAKQGQILDIRVFARALRSPLDSVITLYNSKGGQIALNDDSGGPDSYLRFNPPADGEYTLGITDQLHHGGADFAYRIELTPLQPAIKIQIPEYNQNNQNQERNSIVVARGNRFATLLRSTRSEFGGELKFVCPDLPEGVTMQSENVDAGIDAIPVVFEARADAPLAAKLCDIAASPTDAKVGARSEYVQNVELVYGNNNRQMYGIEVRKLAVAVADEAPYKLRLIAPKVPIVQGGEMKLKVVAERSKDFKGAINVRMLFNPPGIGSAASVDIPADKSEVDYPLSATPNAQSHKWKICVLGDADISGATWVSSTLEEIEVAESFMDMKIDMAATEQGKPCSVLCHIENRTKFDGKADVKLLGLPPNSSAPDMQISADDKQVVFNVATAPNTAVGQHGSLFCQVIVTKNGEPITHNLARGGVLRVDAPPEPKKGEAPKQVVAQAKPSPTAAPVSRLEKLRLEAEAAKAK